MSHPALYQAFSDYNQKINVQIYKICAGISDDERKRDRGAFFKSIHSTLDHLLLGDRAWMSRLSDKKYDLNPIGDDLFADYDELAQARILMDNDICNWAQELTSDWLSQDQVWSSFFEDFERTQPRWLLASHMFNHQTHHRGQLGTLLNQAGYDVGVTDLPRFVM